MYTEKDGVLQYVFEPEQIEQMDRQMSFYQDKSGSYITPSAPDAQLSCYQNSDDLIVGPDDRNALAIFLMMKNE